jgi:hypothetical protein
MKARFVALALCAPFVPTLSYIGSALIAQPVSASEVTGSIGAAGLESGENSFTEEQARLRLENMGLTRISGLTLDARGVWRGKAIFGARDVDVGLDYRGKVLTEPRIDLN